MISIDNFLEKIVPYNEEKFPHGNYTNKEFLNDIKLFSKKYCKFYHVSSQDFTSGKELFKTVFYFTSEEYRNKILPYFKENIRNEINDIIKKNVERIREQEQLFPDFDYKIICESIVNIIMAVDSYEVLNAKDIINGIDLKHPPKNKKDIINSFNVVPKSDIFKINVEDVCQEYTSHEDIEKVFKEVNSSARKNKISKMWINSSAFFLPALAVFSLFKYKIGMPLIFLHLLTTSLLKNNYKKQMESNKIYYRLVYWNSIVYACNEYFQKNIGGEEAWEK